MSNFNYKETSVSKLTDEFKAKFSVNIKGKDCIKLEGLTAFAHEKGMWKFDTELIQFPSDQNGWTAICRTIIGGYDWDPIENKVIRVEYSDIGDANQSNCGKMVASSYIRMASTRSQARALRKYTNIDMLCSSEIDDVVEQHIEYVTTDQLAQIKNIISNKHLTKDEFTNILLTLFGNVNYNSYTTEQANMLINYLTSYQPQSNQNSNA